MSAIFLNSLRAFCDRVRVYSQPVELSRVFDQLEALELDGRGAANSGRVARLGSRILVDDLRYSEQAELTLVAPEQADPERGLISVFSPLGAALIGARLGDIAQVDLGGQSHRFLLVDIRDEKRDKRQSGD